MTAFFGRGKPLTDLKRSDADDWVLHLKAKYAPATVGRTIKGARQLFKAAVRAEMLRTNPFEGIKAGSQPDKDRQFFITLADAEQVINACPDAEWRLLVALSRYGGLRCPSEHFALLWVDVDWERRRLGEAAIPGAQLEDGRAMGALVPRAAAVPGSSVRPSRAGRRLRRRQTPRFEHEPADQAAEDHPPGRADAVAQDVPQPASVP
jgi:hypothetical protein